jgi:peptidoglycan/xylan/chitin deacetylase (PgdA/CDA1 family)
MMRTLVKNMSGIFFSAIPVKQLINLTGQNIILPFYHAVSDESLPHLRHLYSIRSVKKFTNDLDFFLKHYEPVSFSDLFEVLKGTGKVSNPLMALSFDDGLREVYDVIAPLLLKKGIPATFFINTAFADNRGLFFKYKASLIIDRLNKISHPENIYEIINSRMGTEIKSKSAMIRKILDIRYDQQNILDSIAELLDIDFDTFLKIRKPYMKIDQLHDLQTKGFQIGSHSIDHPIYSSLGLDEQLRQTSESMKWISETFDPGYRYFSFPFIDNGVTANFFETIFSKDDRIVDLSFGSSGMKKEKFPFNLQRIPMEKSSLGARFYLRGEYVYYAFKSLFGRDVIKRA